MRVSKRILALALALIMVVGLMTTASANLNHASDAAEVAPEYRLAVGALYTLGLIEGFPDGTFRPETTVNRAQMTNLIFDMVNGPDQAPPLVATQFPDVYEGSGAFWARGYIAWAHGQGIIVGFPDGTFRPNEPVTIVQAATMLLRALGYGRMGEYEGSGWAQRASNDALAQGIFNADIVDEFDITEDSQRQVAAQMIFNTMFARRVTFLSALNVYQPIENVETEAGDRGLFGRLHDLPTTIGGVARRNSAAMGPVIMNNFIPSFVDLDGTPVLGALDLVYSGSHREVGRVVNVYSGVGQVTGDNRILFLDILSTDIEVAAGATNAQRRDALELTNTATLEHGRGLDVMVFQGYTWNPTADIRISVAPVSGIINDANAVGALPNTGFFIPANTLNSVGISLLSAARTTWVEFDDVIYTVLYTTRSVEDVTVVGDTVFFGTLNGPSGQMAVPRSMVIFEDGVTANTFAGTAADAAEYDVNVFPEVHGLWADLSIEIRGGAVRFVVTPVEAITGVIDFVDRGPGTALAFRFAGSTRLHNYVHLELNRQDDAEFSDRLWSLDDFNTPFIDFAFNNAMLPEDQNTTLWTAYISGVTGNVVSVETWSPDFSTAELVMVTGSGWNSTTQTGFATFVREVDGAAVTAREVPAIAHGFAGTAGAQNAALAAMRGNVAWAVEVNGVWFLLGPLGSAPLDFLGVDNSTDIFYAVNGQINLGSISLPRPDHVFALQNAIWILDDGTSGRFPAGNINRDLVVNYSYIIWTVDAATRDNVVVVFVVEAPPAPVTAYTTNAAGELLQNGTAVAPASVDPATGVATWNVTVPAGTTYTTTLPGWIVTPTVSTTGGVTTTTLAITSPAAALAINPPTATYALPGTDGDTLTFTVTTTGYAPDGTVLNVAFAFAGTAAGMSTPATVTTTAGVATVVVTVDDYTLLAADTATVTVTGLGTAVTPATATITVA